MVETVIKGRLDGLKIKAVCIEYRDYPVLEWTVYFKCAGEGQTALLEDVRAIDALFEGKGGLLVHNNGDFYSADGYTEGRTAMTPGAGLCSGADRRPALRPGLPLPAPAVRRLRRQHLHRLARPSGTAPIPARRTA